MNKIYTLLLCLCSLWATAQEGTPVAGNVSDGLQPIEGVHIVNVSTNKASISNREGRFTLPLVLGDTLVFSHVSMQDLIRLVGKDELSKKTISVVMLEKSNELDEVLLQKDRDYALELGIISERKKVPTLHERRLMTAGDFKPIQLLGILGGSLPLDPIINAISGKTKKMKRNVRVEQKMANIDFLKSRYLDYMVKTFGTPAAEIEPFLDHLVELPSLEPVMQARNPEQMKFYLIEEWYKFQD